MQCGLLPLHNSDLLGWAIVCLGMPTAVAGVILEDAVDGIHNICSKNITHIHNELDTSLRFLIPVSMASMEAPEEALV